MTDGKLFHLLRSVVVFNISAVGFLTVTSFLT